MGSKGRIKLLYLAYFAALGAVYPYQVLFLERKGLSATQIGLIGSAAAGVAILPGLLWMTWSDRAGRRKPFVLFGFASQMALWLAISGASSFGQFLFLMLVASTMVPPLEALLNVVVLSGIDKAKTGTEYSLVRIWGSLGWMVSAAVAGTVVQATELRFSFFLGSGLLILCMMLPLGKGAPGAESRTERREEARELRQAVPFIAATVIRALSVGMAYTFLSIYLDDIGTPYWLLGWGWAISALPELPIMVLAGRMSDRMGRLPLLIAGFLCSSTMAFAYAVVRSPVLAVPLLAMSGVSFGLSYIASVGYVADISPYNRQATAQGLYEVLTTNVPRVAGPFLGGVLIDRMGLGTLFSLSGALSLLAALVLVPEWAKVRGRGKEGCQLRDGKGCR